MGKHNRLIALGAAAAMMILILDGKTALYGAAEGISLCVSSLIPALFPFILLSILITSALSGQAISFLTPITSACKMPDGTQALFVVSFLGGYPVGAQSVAQLFRRGELTQSQSARILAFCNNAGPSFIFGILGAFFTNRLIPWILWLIQIFSALCVGFILPDTQPVGRINPTAMRIRITDILYQAIKVTSQICAWVIIMRMVLAFLDSWFLWIFPYPVQVLMSGILELSNGCIRLSEIENDGLRFLLASGILTLGGVCVTLQTRAVSEGISMKLYYPGKILQAAISVFLSCLFQFLFSADSRCPYLAVICTFSAVIALITIFTLHFKKSSGIPSTVGV